MPINSISEYHSQYNRLEEVLQFRQSPITKKHLFFPGRMDNDRLNQIHAKLRNPTGHFELMKKNAILSNKHTGSSRFVTRNRGLSYSTIQMGQSQN